MTATVETNKGIAVAAFRPITWSTKDTKQTIAEIKIHNEVGTKLGFWEAPPTKAVRGWAKIKAKVKRWPAKKVETVMPAPTPTVIAPASIPASSEAKSSPPAANKPTLLQRIRGKLHHKPKPNP